MLLSFPGLTLPPAITTNLPSAFVQRRQETTFQSLFEATAQRFHITLMCDSPPLHGEISQERAGALERTLADTSTSVVEKIRAVGSAFDYDTEWIEGNVFVLRKRYSDPEDLPDVSFEETRARLRNLQKVLIGVDPHAEMNVELLPGILSQLTVDEKAQLAQGVPVRSLRPPLVQQVYRLMYAEVLGLPLGAVRRLSLRLDGLQKSTSQAHWSTNLGLTYPAISGPFALDGAMREVVFGDYIRTSIGGGTAFFATPSVSLKDGVAVGKIEDRTTPNSTGAVLSPSPLTQMTLATLAPSLHIDIDPALTRKTVCLFGAENGTPKQSLSALVTLCGLRIVQSEGKTRLTIPVVPPVHTLAEVPKATRTLFPTAFLRAMEHQMAEVEEERRRRAVARGTAALAPPRFASDTMYLAATKRLRTQLEPLLKASERKNLPLKSVDRTVLDTITLDMLAISIPMLSSLLSDESKRFEGIEDSIFQLEVSGNIMKFSLRRPGTVNALGTDTILSGQFPIPPSATR